MTVFHSKEPRLKPWPLTMFLAAACMAGHVGAQEPDFAVDGRKLFVEGVSGQPNCALCHTLAHAKSESAVGPNLNELAPDADRIKHAVRNGIGPMPAAKWLSDEQVALLARYVEWASKQK